MQEIALVTMKDLTQDRSMRYEEALDGQVKINQYINNDNSSIWNIFTWSIEQRNALQIWRSTSKIDAGLFTIASRSQTISDMYEKCDPIPKVRIMQVFFRNFARR